VKALVTGANGFVGRHLMVALPALFGILWRRFGRPGRDLYGELGQGAVLLMAIGCVFNSFFVDYTEGLFFAWVISAAFASEGLGGSHETC